MNLYQRFFVRTISDFVHQQLDAYQIPHYIDSFPEDCSVKVYIGYIAHQMRASELLMQHPFAKKFFTGVDPDGDAWIQIYF